MIVQFDVCQVSSSRPKPPLVVVLQSHLLSGMTTMLVAPLLQLGATPDEAAALLEVEYRGELFTLSLAQMGSVPIRILHTMGSVADQEDPIRRGIDRLLTGF